MMATVLLSFVLGLLWWSMVVFSCGILVKQFVRTSVASEFNGHL